MLIYVPEQTFSERDQSIQKAVLVMQGVYVEWEWCAFTSVLNVRGEG